ncbi:MAG: PAS domain-containing protein [Bryobacteraceae bacterium]|jgi:PAS domain-containing protein
MESKNSSYYRSILDAIPVAVFIVDSDVRIQAINPAAEALLGAGEAVVRTLRGGEALHCLHSKDSPGGCGQGPDCHSCVIRNSVMEALEGGAVSRRRMKAELLAGQDSRRLDLLVTASRLPGNDGLALLVLEDISEISTLHDIIPICARCKSIRNDQRYWQKVETYFHDYMGVDFSHGLCPECIKQLYPEY